MHKLLYFFLTSILVNNFAISAETKYDLKFHLGNDRWVKCDDYNTFEDGTSFIGVSVNTSYSSQSVWSPSRHSYIIERHRQLDGIHLDREIPSHISTDTIPGEYIHTDAIGKTISQTIYKFENPDTGYGTTVYIEMMYTDRVSFAVVKTAKSSIHESSFPYDKLIVTEINPNFEQGVCFASKGMLFVENQF